MHYICGVDLIFGGPIFFPIVDESNPCSVLEIKYLLVWNLMSRLSCLIENADVGIASFQGIQFGKSYRIYHLQGTLFQYSPCYIWMKSLFTYYFPTKFRHAGSMAILLQLESCYSTTFWIYRWSIQFSHHVVAFNFEILIIKSFHLMRDFLYSMLCEMLSILHVAWNVAVIQINLVYIQVNVFIFWYSILRYWAADLLWLLELWLLSYRINIVDLWRNSIVGKISGFIHCLKSRSNDDILNLKSWGIDISSKSSLALSDYLAFNSTQIWSVSRTYVPSLQMYKKMKASLYLISSLFFVLFSTFPRVRSDLRCSSSAIFE